MRMILMVALAAAMLLGAFVPAAMAGSGASRLSLDWDGDLKLNAYGEAPRGKYQEVLLAQASGEAGQAADPKCAKFAADPHADLGEILKAGCQPTTGQMSALMDDPLGSVAMFINQYDQIKMVNDAVQEEKANKGVYMGILQFPKGVTENWSVINRIVFSVPSMPIEKPEIDIGEFQSTTVTPPESTPAPITLFGGRTTGFGDLYYVGLFTQKGGKKFDGGGMFKWGIGFDAGFPSASDDVLGTGKWTAGPSGLAVYMGPKWKIGGLIQQYWDYAGDDDRAAVNLMNLQYFVYYSIDDTMSIGAGPNIIANWEQDSDNTWTVPIGLGINKTVNIGKVPVRFGFEVHYSVVRPDDTPGTEWDFRFMVIPAVPSALFSWMK